MNKIDNIFKQGLDGKGVNSTADQWSEMSSLLDAEKASKIPSAVKLILWIGVITIVSWSTWTLFSSSTKNHSNDHQNTSNHSIAQIKKEQNSSEANNQTTVNQGNKPNQPVPNIQPNDEESNQSDPNLKTDDVGVRSAQPLITSTFHEPDLESDDSKNGVSKSVSNVLSSIDSFNSFDSFEFVELLIDPKAFVQFPVDEDNPDLNKATHGSPNSRTGWSIHLSPRTDLGVNQPRVQTSFIEPLKSTESSLVTPNYGIDLMLKRNHWVVKTGVGVINLSETTNYPVTSTNWTYDTAFVLVKRNYTLAPNGKYAALLERQIDSTRTSSTNVDCPNCRVDFQYLSIPLSLQYEFHQKRMIYFLELGGSLWLISSANGIYTTFDKDLNEAGAQLSNLSSMNGLRSKLVTVNAGLGAKYRLSPNLNVLLNYNYAHSLSSMMTNYQQLPRLHRVGFGLEILLAEK